MTKSSNSHRKYCYKKSVFFFFPFFLLRFDGNTLARPFTPLSISAANIHFPKCGADWELCGYDPCFLKKENLLDSFSIHKKSDLLDSGPFSCYSIIIKKQCFVLHDLHSFQTCWRMLRLQSQHLHCAEVLLFTSLFLRSFVTFWPW